MRKTVWRNTIRILPVLLLGLAASNVQGQITNTVFFEDFESGVIDPAKFAPDAPFFEGGIGDIAGAVSNGELEFTGTVSQQWWAGATLRVVPTFTVSEEADIIASVDRVQELGVGTASRSAFWIMTADQSKYVLFADVRGEGGWRYNRKIGEPGDVPTGSGTDILAFNGGTFDDGTLRQMKAVANGETVKLYLDDIFGAEVRFPYKDLSFHVGSYARANNDTAQTVFDNLRIETVGKVSFGTSAVTLQQGGSAEGIVVRIPPGANATSAVQIRVVSANPAIAIPVGAVGGTLTLNFAAGASNEQTIDVQATGSGGVTLTLENDIGMGIGNTLNVTIVEPAGIRLEEDFAAATLDPAKWEESTQGFEAGTGGFFTDLVTTPGTLEIYGLVDTDFWPGASIKTVDNFTATQIFPLIVEVDRLAIDPVGTAARTGVFLTTDDRSQFIFFGQNYGETGWHVNRNPGNPTGSGTALGAFASLAGDVGPHRLKIVADGEIAEVFLDGVSGGQFAFPVSSGLHVEIGSYARAVNDFVSGRFDNVKIENAVPCIGAGPRTITTAQGVNTSTVTVTIPRLLNATEAVDVTVTSQDPNVAAPAGAVAGVLTLNFAAGAANSQSFQIRANSPGQTTLEFATTSSACVDASVAITVTAPIGPVFTDDFATAIDPASWLTSNVALDAAAPGTATAASAVTVVNGEVQMNVTAETGNWPGFALTTVASYSAQLLSPVGFEVDRVSLGFTLVTGTSAKQRTGVWVLSGTNSLFFGEYATWDGTAGGWQFNRVIGQAGDTPLPAAGVSLAAFNAAQFNNQGNQRIKVVVNGETARLYLNDTFGGEVPFPFSTDIKFGFGTYVLAATDIAVGTFDNATVLGEVEGAVTDGIVAYWSFDDHLFDSIKDFHGTARGTAPIPFVDGKAGFGKAIKLNAGKFVEITGGNEDELEFPGGSMSIAGWFKVDAFDTEWQALIAKGEGENWRVARRANTGTIAYAGGVGEGADDVPAVNDGAWHHFVAVSDATGAEFGTALYVDGVRRGVNATLPVLAQNERNVLIGANPDTTPNRAWNGEIDDIGIWNRVLSAAEVAELYNSGTGTALSTVVDANITGIGLNFGASQAGGTVTATDIAGVPGVAQANWNNLNGQSGTNVVLVGNAGGTAEAVTTTVDWNSNNLWSSTGAGEENNLFTGPDLALTTGYLDTDADTTSTVTITGIPGSLTDSQYGYDVYVYALGGVPGRGGAYQVVNPDGGAVIRGYVTSQSPTNSTSYVMVPPTDPPAWPAGNYVVFRGLTAPDIRVEGTTVDPWGFGSPNRAPINAVQLVPALEAGPVAPVEISSIVLNADGTITVTWSGGGVLEAAQSVDGPWAEIEGATSPFTFPVEEQALFGRIRVD